MQSFKITSEYPLWLVIFCLLLGATLSFALYYKDKRFKEVDNWIVKTNYILRALTISIISFLLLNPLIKSISNTVEKPIIIIAQDNSQSILIRNDSAEFKNNYSVKIKSLINSLDENYEIKNLSFGDKILEGIDYKFLDKQTDFSNLFSDIYTKYYNRNIGAIIIATDGIYNKGVNPIFSSKKLNTPIYSIALGDTSQRKDVLISDVNNNSLTYLGNKFPIEVFISAKEFSGERCNISISQNGKNIKNEIININSNSFNSKHSFLIEAESIGTQQYTVSISNLKDEITYLNNKYDIFIDVIDGKQKILILGNSPHPDISALKNSIETNENYQVDVEIGGNIRGNVKDYNLIILNQIPSSNVASNNFLKQILESNIPTLFILGTETSFAPINNNRLGLKIKPKGSFKSNESQAVFNKNFNFFSLSDASQKSIEGFSPLNTHYADYKTSLTSNVFLYQRIGAVKTDMPLMCFNQVSGKKIGFITGEGIWKWRLQDYKQNKNHDVFNEITNKIVQYLSIKVDKSYFKINTKNVFLENEAIIIDAELYNDSYELVNTPDIELNIKNTENKQFKYTFDKTNNSYRLNAGQFPVGVYTYSSEVNFTNKTHKVSGTFTIKPIQVENINTTANHQLLYQLSNSTDGKMFYENELKELTQELQNRKDIKSVSYFIEELKELIHQKWIFFLLIVLISAELFLRKYSGSY